MIYPVKLKLEFNGVLFSDVVTKCLIQSEGQMTDLACYMDLVSDSSGYYQSDLIGIIHRLEVAEMASIEHGGFTISLWG